MIKRIVENFQAWRRGDRRQNKTAVRGRVYIRSGEKAGPPNVVSVKSQPSGRLVPARVYNASEGSWYTVEEWQARSASKD